jgi:hypothetical protein
LWINNHNGTFSEQLSVYFKHTSANAMGTDVVDINNDGLSDVVARYDPEDISGRNDANATVIKLEQRPV